MAEVKHTTISIWRQLNYMTAASGYLLWAFLSPHQQMGLWLLKRASVPPAFTTLQLCEILEGHTQIYLGLSQPHSSRLSGPLELCWSVLHISSIGNSSFFPLAWHLVEEGEKLVFCCERTVTLVKALCPNLFVFCCKHCVFIRSSTDEWP